MVLSEEIKEALRLQVNASVNEAFERKLNEEEEPEKDDDKSDEDESEEVAESGDEDDDEEEEESEEDDDPKPESDEELSESMKVEAMPVHGTRKSQKETMNISRHADLLKLAKSGKYEWFMVTKNNGEEVEYTVDFSRGRPELVEM